MNGPRARARLLPWALVLAALLASATAPVAAADHPAERVVLVVIDGPRHDLAHDPEGPLAPLYALAPNGTVAKGAHTAGLPRTVPGHAALLTARPQRIANDGSEAPEGPLLWEVLRDAHGWGPAEMRFLYQKDKLAVLAPEDAVAAEKVAGWPPDEVLLDAGRATLADAEARLVVTAFMWPDVTGHRGEWDAHAASLDTISRGLAPLVAEEASEDTLVIVTADHARDCDDPEDHGHPRVMANGPMCDARIPLLAWGWHVPRGGEVDACVTQADVAALVAHALDARFPEDAPGRVPAPLVDANATAWTPTGCPPALGLAARLPVPAAGAPVAVAALALARGLTRRRG